MRFGYVSVLVVLSCALLYTQGLAQLTTMTYAATDSIFCNPDRGLHEGIPVPNYPYNHPDYLNVGTLVKYRSEGVSLIRKMYFLSDYLTSNISQGLLDSIQHDLNTMRTAGVRCILRFAYTKHADSSDAELSVMLGHIDQLGPLLQANSDVISVMQAGFIGAWGEWCFSTHGYDTLVSAQKQIVEKLLSVLPKNRMVQIRCVIYKKHVFSQSSDGTDTLDPDSAFNGSNVARVGLHSDAFCTNWSDAGTFQLDIHHGVGLDTTVLKPYLAAESRYVPTGGESYPDVAAFRAKANVLSECARFHWSYQNKTYSPTVINEWAGNGTLDTMKLRLGYRFSLVDAEANTYTTAGGILHLKIRVVNTGWASPFNPHTVEILFRNVANNSLYGATLPDDPRLWAPGSIATIDRTIGIPATLPLGAYTLLLNLPDPDSSISTRPEYSIRLANANVWEPGTGYNSLLRTVSIQPGTGSDTYKNLIELRPLRIYSDVNQGSDGLPKGYGLGQNFPNPFNPVTTIRYQLPTQTFVALKIFNVLGQLVKTLVEEEKPAGIHQVALDSSNLASGIYIYRLESRNFTAARRCVVMK